jgi:hypothetical protein
METKPQKRVYSNGDQEWTVDGLFHRTDGPAFIDGNGTQAWYINGRCHRTDGPAIIRVNGAQEWWINGERHRLDGPAIIWANGRQEWYLNDRNITQEVKIWMRKQNITWPWNEEIRAQFALTFT